MTERVRYAIEPDPNYVDVAALRDLMASHGSKITWMLRNVDEAIQIMLKVTFFLWGENLNSIAKLSCYNRAGKRGFVMKPHQLFAIGVLAAVSATALAQAQTYAVLHTFSGGITDGANPSAGVIGDSAGNLYGTTFYGGTDDAGIVYKLDSTGKETVLYSFTGGTDGAAPAAKLFRDSSGSLYGTTEFGGIGACSLYSFKGCGVVFSLTPPASPGGAWRETVLYSFTGGIDGSQPYAGVIRDSSGNLYGTAQTGGTSGCGVVFMLDTTGKQTVLHSFTGNPDGCIPSSGVYQDPAGNLYGTTEGGGLTGGGCNGNECGVIYKLDATFTYSVLYSFTGGTDGANPYGGVIQESSGNLYGTTSFGGGGAGLIGSGVVYKLDNTGKETVLYSFTGGTDGANPSAGVIRNRAGNLFGATSNGGTVTSACPSGCGVVYKLDTTGKETVLYSFAGGADGANPSAGVIRDPAGRLYGTTYDGGSANCLTFGISGCGVVFKLKP